MDYDLHKSTIVITKQFQFFSSCYTDLLCVFISDIWVAKRLVSQFNISSLIMRNTLLREALHEISEDTKLVRLATITTFIHSLLFILYILYVLVTLWEIKWAKTWMWDLMSEYISLIDGSATTIVVILVLAICLAIWYLILPPIGDAAMINYIASDKKSGTTALSSGFGRFFPMMEFNATLWFINLVTRAIAVSRFYVLGVLNSGLIITLILLWFLVIIISMILLPYTKMLITLENQNYFDAMKASTDLAIHNIWTTIKFVMINIFLYIRFIINILIVVGIPLWLLYVASEFDIIDSDITQWFIVAILLGLIALTAYINGIIEAFFVTYWYKLYKKITEEV